MRSTRLAIIVLLSLATFASACGGSDDDTSADDTSVSDEAPEEAADAESDDDATETTEAAEPAESNCAATEGTFQTADGATTLTATDAIAGSILEGQAYTIYLADRTLSEDELGIISVPEPGAGEVIVAVAITTFNPEGSVEPVVAGEVVEYTSDFGVRTFVVTADLGETFLGDSTDAGGTITVTSIGASICGEVTYTDGEKTLNAVFDAPIVPV